MAMVDYGAVVFKNGKFINQDEFFMKMEKAVGWVDYPDIRYPDCDCTEEYKGEKYSNCENCPRANREKVEIGERTYMRLISDCRNEPWRQEHRANGEYFAYIGNKKLTFAFYKTMCAVYMDGKFVKTIWRAMDDNNYDHRVLRMNFDGVEVVIRSLAPSILTMSVKIDGDLYHVIYGYGIDSDMKVWNRAKVRYVGRKYAKRVDKLIEKFWTDKQPVD